MADTFLGDRGDGDAGSRLFIGAVEGCEEVGGGFLESRHPPKLQKLRKSFAARLKEGRAL